MRNCYLTVNVKDTDYDAPDEYVVNTTVNGGYLVHGKCSSSQGAVLNGRGFFECAKYVPLPFTPDGTYTFVTTATPAVDENPYEGSFVYATYMVDCEGSCHDPSAPPSSPPPSAPPSVPPPRAPSCTYDVTAEAGEHPQSLPSSLLLPRTDAALPRTRWERHPGASGSLHRLREPPRPPALLASPTFSAAVGPAAAVTSAAAAALVSRLAVQDLLSRRLPAVLGRRDLPQ